VSSEPLTLRFYGDPVLRRKADPVAAVTPEIQDLIREMFDCMYRERGIGLAAPQVGASRRVFVVDVEDEEGVRVKRAFVNPAATRREGSMVGEEGCLSIPGIRADVKRAATVAFEALDENGAPFRMEARGILARALQHELDHLDGVLFIDRLSAIRRKLLEPKLERLRVAEAGDAARTPGALPSM
jgi:peptide deformylase